MIRHHMVRYLCHRDKGALIAVEKRFRHCLPSSYERSLEFARFWASNHTVWCDDLTDMLTGYVKCNVDSVMVMTKTMVLEVTCPFMMHDAVWYLSSKNVKGGLCDSMYSSLWEPHQSIILPQSKGKPRCRLVVRFCSRSTLFSTFSHWFKVNFYSDHLGVISAIDGLMMLFISMFMWWTKE